MRLKDKVDMIYRALKPHGPISKSGALELSRVDGIIELLGLDVLPSSNRQRPSCPVSEIKRSSCGRRSQYRYRQGMAGYLRPWIEVSADLPWTVYEALANYCESKSKRTRASSSTAL